MRIRFFLLAAALLALPGCVRLTLAWAELEPNGPAAAPPVLGAFDGAPAVAAVADWENARAPMIRAALQSAVYGFMPEASQTRILSRRTLNTQAFGGKGRLEEYRLVATATFGGVAVDARDDDGGGFVMDVVSPNGAEGPVPVILMETFCPRWDTLPDAAVAGAPAGGVQQGGFMNGVATYIFGRYICTPPVEAILDAGYAIATIFPSEIVPDRGEDGLAELKRLSAGHADDDTRWGAIAAWAWAYSRMIDALEADPQFDAGAMIAWGHSRYAKAALVAAAFDPRIDGVIAHQSGTGGASLNVNKKGESIAAIARDYPHWFAKAYASFPTTASLPPVDQHQLLALIAPRPVLLGNARRDVWSDPNGALRAAIGAQPVYALYDARGLDKPEMKTFDPTADLAIWIRPGTHGVVEEDWPAFLDFLDAHFSRKEKSHG